VRPWAGDRDHASAVDEHRSRPGDRGRHTEPRERGDRRHRGPDRRVQAVELASGQPGGVLSGQPVGVRAGGGAALDRVLGRRERGEIGCRLGPVPGKHRRTDPGDPAGQQ
jgi:hypothetical protein